MERLTWKPSGVTARTAFALAPSGNYAVVSRPEEAFDVIGIVSAAGGDPIEIARVPHLPGFTATGAVSADGRMVALVAADGGSLARPEASLLVMDLEVGRFRQVLSGVDTLQAPLWAPDGRTVVVSRAIANGSPRPAHRFLRVAADGSGSTALYDVEDALGAYAVGFEPAGALLGVRIDGAGSHLTRDGLLVATISNQITRDWRLSPDGRQLAFIEANLDAGLRYVARTVSLDGTSGRTVEAQSRPGGQQLGVAWRPGASVPTVGQQPLASSTARELGRGEHQIAAGFDVPLDFSRDGSALAVNHWEGVSFADAGSSSLEIVTEAGRINVAGYSRFFGWASR